jgi:hypothetical protein
MLVSDVGGDVQDEFSPNCDLKRYSEADPLMYPVHSIE